MLGFTENLRNILQGLRVKELQISKPFRRLLSAQILFSMHTLALFLILALSNIFNSKWFCYSSTLADICDLHSLFAVYGKAN